MDTRTALITALIYVPLSLGGLFLLYKYQNFLWENIISILLTLAFVIYIILSVYFTQDASASGFAAFSTTSNVIWLIVGAILSVGLFIRLERDGAQKAWREFSAASGFRDKSKALGSGMGTFLKVLIGIALILGIFIGLIYLIGNVPGFSVWMGIVMELMTALVVLMGVYLLTRDFIGGLAERFPILKALYHGIMLIPCVLVYLVEFIYTQVKVTPFQVYAILAIEAVIIACYFLFPKLMRLIYTKGLGGSTPPPDTSMRQQGVDAALVKAMNQVSHIEAGLSIDWKKTLDEKLYLETNKDALIAYLISAGYEKATASDKKSFKQALFGKEVSLEVATTYVQTNGAQLASLKESVATLSAEHKGLVTQGKEQTYEFNTQILLSDPIYTDVQTDLGGYKEETYTGEYNYNYAVSCWIFLHDQPPSAGIAYNKPTSLVNFSGRPNILYDTSTGTLQFTVQSATGTPNVVYETQDFQKQYWTNILVNYTSGTLDIFMNGKLVASKSGVIPYMTHDKVTVGADDGISGGVCNVAHFSRPLTKPQIDAYYASLRLRNPPVV